MRFALPLVIRGEHTPRLPSDGPAGAKPRPLLPRCSRPDPDLDHALRLTLNVRLIHEKSQLNPCHRRF